MTRFILRLVIFSGATLLFAAPLAHAASSTETYLRGKVVSIKETPGSPETATVQLASGPTVTATISGLSNTLDVLPSQFRPGDAVIVSTGQDLSRQRVYSVIDHYRLSKVGFILGLIVLLGIIFAGWRGVGSLVGLGLSIAVLAGFVIPQTLRTGNPYPPTILGGAIIAVLGIYLAHGLTRKTTIALTSTIGTLGLAVGLSVGIVHLLHLSGVSSDNIYYLQQLKPGLNISGLLACGMIISMIGILDDITVGQATSIDEIRRANPSLSIRELYERGSRVGREHIASLINTLVLAYVGTSILFITYIMSVSPYPFWITLNSGVVMEEIARSLVGAITLILAVPITTLLAARFGKTRTPPTSV